jgi:hypothetical protein
VRNALVSLKAQLIEREGIRRFGAKSGREAYVPLMPMVGASSIPPGAPPPPRTDHLASPRFASSPLRGGQLEGRPRGISLHPVRSAGTERLSRICGANYRQPELVLKAKATLLRHAWTTFSSTKSEIVAKRRKNIRQCIHFEMFVKNVRLVIFIVLE